MFIVYGKPSCPFCVKAEALLKRQEQEYKYINVMEDESSRQMLKDQGLKTVPQIFDAEGNRIGGHSELVVYYNK